MRREPRLQFTKEERENPALEKPIRKADRAAARADKAQAKVPRRKVKQHTMDPETGAVTVRLQFEDKKPPSKLQHALRDAPADTALGAVHREVRQSEANNVGVESAHKTEEAAESAGRLVRAGYRSHKLRPYRKAAAAERKLEKANLNALYQKSLQENPGLSSSPLSRWQQKQAIKRQYAAARRAGQTAATVGQTTAHTAQSAKAAAKKSRQAADFARRHKKGFLIAASLFLAVAFFLNCMSSCSVLVQGGMSGIASTTYPSTDEAMLGAEDAYAGMEAELQDYLDTYESTHSYDEYHFDLDEIGHDPYVLVSILTAYHQGEWTLDEVQGTLDMLFEKQYILTERVVVETRYDSEGDPLFLVHLLCDLGKYRPVPPAGLHHGRGPAFHVRYLYGYPGQPPRPVPAEPVPQRLPKGGLPGLRCAPGGIGGRAVCRHAGGGGEIPGLPLCVGRELPGHVL